MPTIRSKYFAGLSRNTMLLACASLFSDISTEMLYPILPVFLTQVLNASGSVVGLIDGIAQATQNIVQGFSGWLSDKLQRRKSIALVGSLMSALAKPFMGTATAWSTVFSGRLIDRLGAGIRSAPRDALVAASVAEQDRGKAFGLEGFGDNLGACLGPLLAVLLLVAWQINIRRIFYVAFIPGLLSFLMLLLVRERAVKIIAKTKLDLAAPRFPRSYWRYLLVTALFVLGNSSNAFLILQTRDVGVSLANTILIYAAFNFVAAVISYPAGWLSDHWGRKRVLLAAFVVYFVTYLGFAITKNLAIVAALFILYGIYQGIFRAVGKAYASDFVPPSLRASGVGWYSTTVGVLQLVASIVAGLLWDTVSHVAVFLYGALFAMIGGMALIALLPARPATIE